MTIPIELAEMSVLRILHGEVLKPSFVEEVCRRAFQSRKTDDDRPATLAAERDELRAEAENLTLRLKKAKSEAVIELIMEEYETVAKRPRASSSNLRF